MPALEILAYSGYPFFYACLGVVAGVCGGELYIIFISASSQSGAMCCAFHKPKQKLHLAAIVSLGIKTTSASHSLVM